MIVADTNVLSELLRPRPDARVLAWSHTLDLHAVWVTAITEAEIFGGIAMMPAGRRRAELEAAAAHMFATVFSGRVLAFDSAAAKCFPQVVARRRDAGRPIEFPDALIASICIAHKAAIATRDTGGFDGLGISVVNPWTDQSR